MAIYQRHISDHLPDAIVDAVRMHPPPYGTLGSKSQLRGGCYFIILVCYIITLVRYGRYKVLVVVCVHRSQGPGPFLSYGKAKSSWPIKGHACTHGSLVTLTSFAHGTTIHTVMLFSITVKVDIDTDRVGIDSDVGRYTPTATNGVGQIMTYDLLRII